MKDYYIGCDSCGIISGKIYGFKEAKKLQKSHIQEHKLKGTSFEAVFIHDWEKLS